MVLVALLMQINFDPNPPDLRIYVLTFVQRYKYIYVFCVDADGSNGWYCHDK